MNDNPPHLMTPADYFRMAETPWRERYEELGNRVRALLQTLPAGRTFTTGEFAVRLYPNFGALSAKDKGIFSHWLVTVAKHQNLALGTRQDKGSGYMRGKIVTRYVWGRPKLELEDLI